MANYELSNRIYELRTQKGLSQKELGAILGVSNKAVSKWETGTAIPKTETLIKLAEVFEVSTEELLNMALPLHNLPPTNERPITIPTNARIGKTLSEFRAEKGLYLKDVAEKIGVSENELHLIEESNLVPDEIADKLVLAYNLPENNFAKPVFKPKTVTKKYFLKTAFIYEMITGLISAIPLIFASTLATFARFFDTSTLEDISWYIRDLHLIVSPIVATVGGVLLGKYLTEKSGYIGDFNRYRFLYATIPVAAPVAINALETFVLRFIYNCYQDNAEKVSSIFATLLQGALELVFSVVATAIIVIILAMLMNNAIEPSFKKARQIFQKIAIFVTTSSVLACVIDFFDAQVYWSDGQFQWKSYKSFNPIETLLPYVVSIVIVWLVYSITEHNPKKEKWAFKILPLLSIWGIAIAVVIEFIGLGFDYLLEMLADWMLSAIP